MATQPRSDAHAAIPSFCTLSGRTFPVRVKALSSSGCRVEADGNWPQQSDFLRLTLGGEVEVNGRGARANGRELQVLFFGQIHPVAVERLTAEARPR